MSQKLAPSDPAQTEIQETQLIYQAVTHYNLAACYQRNLNSSMAENYQLCD
jgi:hypothetical protein